MFGLPRRPPDGQAFRAVTVTLPYMRVLLFLCGATTQHSSAAVASLLW
jgi:hypothetical protein